MFLQIDESLKDVVHHSTRKWSYADLLREESCRASNFKHPNILAQALELEKSEMRVEFRLAQLQLLRFFQEKQERQLNLMAHCFTDHQQVPSQTAGMIRLESSIWIACNLQLGKGDRHHQTGDSQKIGKCRCFMMEGGQTPPRKIPQMKDASSLHKFQRSYISGILWNCEWPGVAYFTPRSKA